MNIFDLIKYRRSIRKYQDKQIKKEDLEKIIEAGLYAPNAGGGQRTLIYGIHNKELCEKIGKFNASCFSRANLAGCYVSKEQPSIIDDPAIKSGFYGAPAVCVIFGADNFIYNTADSFCCAENMVLAAAEMGIFSCIVARGKETFDNEEGRKILKEWNVPENYTAQCFVALGYCDGEYPSAKPRKENRWKIIE